jgi:hypothetical protein
VGDDASTTSTSGSSRARQLPAALGQAEQYLQVDLVVGAIDAGRVVDEIGIDAPSGGRVLDARAAARVALPHDPRATRSRSRGSNPRTGRRRRRRFVEAFTTVPMPFHSRSTCARRIAR